MGVKCLIFFEVEILLLYKNMQLGLMKVIKLLLEFLRFFYGEQAHNMMAIMLDSHFKALWIVQNLVGYVNGIWLTFEYDVKVVVPLLMVCFDRLNPIATTWCCKTRTWENMFSVQASIEKSSWAWITRKLYLFTKFFYFLIFMCRSINLEANA